MSVMKVLSGDLIQYAKDRKFDIIFHGCNCFHTMGAGIAYQIQQSFPGAYTADKKSWTSGDWEKLGKYSSWKSEDGKLTVLNAYTQYKPGANFEYSALDQVTQVIAKNFRNMTIAYPKVGAGIGGGDWRIIEDILNYNFQKLDHTLVLFEPKAEKPQAEST
jgi:O-acetyl-ADP-ribose deacetylase (regulator of RNase III)